MRLSFEYNVNTIVEYLCIQFILFIVLIVCYTLVKHNSIGRYILNNVDCYCLNTFKEWHIL